MSNALVIPLADGSQLNARIDGPETAPCVLFSNSVLTDLTVWDAQARALSGRYRVLRYDQRGHGTSDVTQGPMNFVQYGADVIALLNACNIDSCIFVGLSMGVPTGLAAYAAAPARFDGFVAVDGVSRSAPGREAFWTERRDTARASGMEVISRQTASRWLPGLAEDAPEITRLEQMIAATPVEGFATATHALGSYDLSTVVGTLAVPVLGITGEEDGAMPQAVRSQFGAVPGAQFHDIPSAGHVPNFQAPDAFTPILDAFLRSVAKVSEQESR
ncbi:alpha/beta fold hydrolase [Paracoccus saliphilus]|uniref:3-oxoadipate enol-lactonase/3-oxoadipate enol-lactonase / 4-carboxymuconolactone decarboxylase n=1 Tax=Paracoccus saliphilus TaxID=405559 RepID=A0AA46A6J6_9RHOB|nr:alpha/beta fold hydrolase [Paracoccus saliphilus]WCR01538.1 alpha/beta fold hydrolase [Paracoccus saliphilus]SIS99134.1 3-oxoadipate enol-lactonase/3-oxoadipate enol-lactonase / 4-carboxymuconolactone decarboxylase [Paracoccus saliphilus]